MALPNTDGPYPNDADDSSHGPGAPERVSTGERLAPTAYIPGAWAKCGLMGEGFAWARAGTKTVGKKSGRVVIVLPAGLGVVKVTGPGRENGLLDEEVAEAVTPLERSVIRKPG